MPRHATVVTCLLLLALGLAACQRKPAGSTDAPSGTPGELSDQFLSLMNTGKNWLDQGDATNALAVYKKAEAIRPNDADLRLNLANACLLAGAALDAVREANEVLRLDPNSAAAWFIKGSAHLRLSDPEEAVKAFENARKIDPSEPAAYFQLGRARMELKQWEEAVAAFKDGIAIDPNHLHRAAHYLMAQSLLRAGHQAEAEKELQQHLANLEEGGPAVNTATFERSKYTQARVPFKLEQPARQGERVTFVDSTEAALGDRAAAYSGPIGVIDPNQSGWNSLVVREREDGFRVLRNTNGTFHPADALSPAEPGAAYRKMLVGDLQNDRISDIVVLGEQGSFVFGFATNGAARIFAALDSLSATDGLLIDLDFTGKLDLVAVSANTNDVRLYRQFGPLLYSDVTSTSGIPVSLREAQAVAMEDWNRDGHMDLIIGTAQARPMLLEKRRGGPLVQREMTNWVAGAAFCTGDFDNDLRPDLAVLGDETITVCFNGGARSQIPAGPYPSDRRLGRAAGFSHLTAIDYDNDGWLDLWLSGQHLRAWRNRGLAGFEEQTAQLGLDQLKGGAVTEVHFADFDMDCDPDAIVALAAGGLRYLQNHGGNANSLVKVRLLGNRSNASGIGCKVEIETGGLRLLRTVQRLPVEIGVGKYQKLDSFLVHWFNWPQGSAGLPVDCKQPILVSEMTIQEGSCPYLYAWDGEDFRFVTDILGAAPLGLPVAPGCYTQADPEEFVWIGDERSFPATDGKHVLQITEELREVLYLDEAKLVVVDHEPGVEVHPTDKLLPSGPFPPGTLMTLHNEYPLRHGETLEGADVTANLRAVDNRRVSPPRLRTPQLRGLAEPHGLILDFGPLDATKPLVLVMNGWIRFGGGMANIAASLDPALPFPFPVLEAEIAPGTWKNVDVTVGAPAGKTKTILADLEGKLETGTHRLRLTQAFEIHWDRIALMEKKLNPSTTVTFIAPTGANLHFRGFSSLRALPPDWPLTPEYNAVSPNSYWTIIPGGWCTRYGNVSELIVRRDEGLALINAGDELTLSFAVESLPPKPEGSVREFYLYADGWDKDSDFHVASGTTIEPLPFHGMRDELYGRELRPPFPSDALHRKYNTRWVEGKMLRQIVHAASPE